MRVRRMNQVDQAYSDMWQITCVECTRHVDAVDRFDRCVACANPPKRTARLSPNPHATDTQVGAKVRRALGLSPELAQPTRGTIDAEIAGLEDRAARSAGAEIMEITPYGTRLRNPSTGFELFRYNDLGSARAHAIRAGTEHEEWFQRSRWSKPSVAGSRLASNVTITIVRVTGERLELRKVAGADAKWTHKGTKTQASVPAQWECRYFTTPDATPHVSIWTID